MLQEAINAAAQVGFAIFIAAIAYLLAGKSRGNFFRFAGLIAPPADGVRFALIAAMIVPPLAIAGIYFSPLRDLASGPNTVPGAIRALGPTPEAFGVIALTAIFKTALAEEILFRGVIGKTLIRWFGFAAGNSAQALVFGSIHLLIFAVPGAPALTPLLALSIAALPTIEGFVFGWINEKKAGGSIAPGWISHALTNLIAYPILAFG